MSEQRPWPAAMTRRRRAIRPLAGTLAVLAALVAAGVWAAAPPAYAQVVTAAYAIGTPTNAVASVVASPATLSQSAPTTFVVKFRATVALSGTGSSSVTITSSAALATAPTSVALIDDSNSACFQAGSNGGPVGTTTITVDLVASCNVATGDEVEVDFTASGPSSIGDFTLAVTTSGNGSPAASNTLMVEPAPPTVSATSVVLGANATYTLSGASWTTLGASVNALVLTAKASAGTTISWYSGGSGYLVTYTPQKGAPAGDVVQAVHVGTTSTSNDTVILTLATALVAGDRVTISGKGTNPSSTSTNNVSVAPETGAAGSLSAAGSAETSTNALVFGTFVNDVTVVPSPSVALAPATYVVSFQATSRLTASAGAQVCLSESAGPTVFSGEKGPSSQTRRQGGISSPVASPTLPAALRPTQGVTSPTTEPSSPSPLVMT